jgi:hypothetical protein
MYRGRRNKVKQVDISYLEDCNEVYMSATFPYTRRTTHRISIGATSYSTKNGQQKGI